METEESPFQRLVGLAKYASNLDLGPDTTFSVENATHRGEQCLKVTIHRPTSEVLRNAKVLHHAVTEGWTDCAPGDPTNVYRVWTFFPEAGIEFIVYEQPARGTLLDDLPVKERRAYIKEALRRSEKAKLEAAEAAAGVEA